VADDKASKRAENKAQLDAATEAVGNWNQRQKLHALELLLKDKELKKAPLEAAFEAWAGRQLKTTQEKLAWLRDAFATRYQRKQDDGTYAPRLREASTELVVERLVDFALSASERDREVEKDLGLFEYTADAKTGEALLGLSDKVYGFAVEEQKYHQAQALLRKLAQQHGNLEVDGTPLTQLVATVQSGLKTVGKLDLGLPERLGGLRTAREEAEYKKRFAAYLKGQAKKAKQAEEASKALGLGGDGTSEVATEVVSKNK
jgi:hypothetical protein